MITRHTIDWHGAAGELVTGLALRNTIDARIRLLDELCERLDGQLYPAFLQLLCLIQRDGSDEVRALVTDTLVHALASGRLPVGRMPAWGASANSPPTALVHARSLGPIEYVCAWRAQPSELPSLSARGFRVATLHLLQLVSVDPAARTMYCNKLLSDAEDTIGGSLARPTRHAMRALARSWRDDSDVSLAVDAFERAVEAQRESRLSQIVANPFV